MNIDFKVLVVQEKSTRMKMRLLALALFQKGYSRSQISKLLKVSRTSVNSWVKAYLSEGLEGLQEKPRSGRPALLTPSQQKSLAKYIEQHTSLSTNKRLTGSDIHRYIKTEFGKDCHPDHVYTLLKKLGFSWVTSRTSKP
ncbi:TPA: transposase [Vibrio parahaemolyticus]|nr:transposase [Vibrio parahaemolyticus]HBB9976820.1 transposase [Vibrio parahaemolyticus]HBC0013372.1 transposase [Vibrio parahaemolyticus]